MPGVSAGTNSDTASSSSSSSYRPGDVVLTAYGVGVIVSAHNGGGGSGSSEENDGAGFFGVRLWRRPGESISSASLAHLRSSTVSVHPRTA